MVCYCRVKLAWNRQDKRALNLFSGEIAPLSSLLFLNKGEWRVFLTYPRQNISRLWLQRVKAKAEMMRWELKPQISGQHCRAVSVPEHCAGFVKELTSRRETPMCLHWERGVVGREWKIGEGKMGLVSLRLHRVRKSWWATFKQKISRKKGIKMMVVRAKLVYRRKREELHSSDVYVVNWKVEEVGVRSACGNIWLWHGGMEQADWYEQKIHQQAGQQYGNWACWGEGGREGQKLNLELWPL